MLVLLKQLYYDWLLSISWKNRFEIELCIVVRLWCKLLFLCRNVQKNYSISLLLTI